MVSFLSFSEGFELFLIYLGLLGIFFLQLFGSKFFFHLLFSKRNTRLFFLFFNNLFQLGEQITEPLFIFW